MNKISITREQVIEAIKKEPLKAGRFFHTSTSNSSKTCKVCAVGAVLRETIPNSNSDMANEFIGNYEFVSIFSWDGSDDILKGLPSMPPEEGSWLNWLSLAFETLMDKYQNDLSVVRPYLIEFVEDTFPESFIPGE